MRKCFHIRFYHVCRAISMLLLQFRIWNTIFIFVLQGRKMSPCFMFYILLTYWMQVTPFTLARKMIKPSVQQLSFYCSIWQEILDGWNCTLGIMSSPEAGWRSVKSIVEKPVMVMSFLDYMAVYSRSTKYSNSLVHSEIVQFHSCKTIITLQN